MRWNLTAPCLRGNVPANTDVCTIHQERAGQMCLLVHRDEMGASMGHLYPSINSHRENPRKPQAVSTGVVNDNKAIDPPSRFASFHAMAHLVR